MNAICRCGARYPYTFGPAGCSPECRYDWEAAQVSVAPPRVGSRVRVNAGWGTLDGLLGWVISSSPLLVSLDDDPNRHLGFGPSALDVLP